LFVEITTTTVMTLATQWAQDHSTADLRPKWPLNNQLKVWYYSLQPQLCVDSRPLAREEVADTQPSCQFYTFSKKLNYSLEMLAYRIQHTLSLSPSDPRLASIVAMIRLNRSINDSHQLT